MKVGMEPDLVEELDREEESAIAAVVRARFGKGDLTAALRAMDAVSTRRLKMRAKQAVRRYA